MLYSTLLFPLRGPGDLPTRGFIGGGVRIAYNLNAHLAVGGAAIMGSTSGLTWLSPSASVVLTTNLNANMSPYFLAGVGISRWSGARGTITSKVDMSAGAGLRRFVSRSIAFDLEWRFIRATINERSLTAWNSIASFGLLLIPGGGR